MGAFLVEGDSDDEASRPARQVAYPCLPCIERLTKSGAVLSCRKGGGESCTMCGRKHSPCV